MFIPADRLDDAYSGIKRGAVESHAPVLVFVALDADALCASKILLSLLKADFISYKIVPVGGYTDLARANDELIDGHDELRSIVMLNCGGLVDLTELLALAPETTVYVIDSHRPLHLANICSSAQICVLDDGEIAEDMQEERAAFELVEYADSDSDDVSDTSESEGDEDVPEKISGSVMSANGGGDEAAACGASESTVVSTENTLVDDEDGRPLKMRRIDGGISSSGSCGPRSGGDGDATLSLDESRRARRRQARRTISTYYSSGTFYGGSVAGILYALGTQIARASCDTLWWAIIGLTDQFVFERIERERYLAQYAVFQDEVARISPPVMLDNILDLAETATINPDQTSITSEQDLRFMHHRHWSLYDSMFHSSYVASRLAVWREKGRNRLLNLLAKMGISQPQYQQPHKHMNVDLRTSLRTKISRTAPEYGLHELYFPSFVRTYGWEYKFSSADVVYAVTAVLECSPGIAASLGAHIDWKGGSHSASAVVDAGGIGATDGNEAFGLGFYKALDALDNVKLLRSAVDLSMRLQRVVVRQGTSMIERQSVKTFKAFRLAVLRDEPDLQILCHPLTLSKLSLFLVDAMREYGKTNLPFVLAVLDEQKGRYLVAGVSGSARHGDVRKNKFGLAFQATAVRTGARIKHDSFETATLEIKKEDLSGFMEALQSEMRI